MGFPLMSCKYTYSHHDVSMISYAISEDLTVIIPSNSGVDMVIPMYIIKWSIEYQSGIGYMS